MPKSKGKQKYLSTVHMVNDEKKIRFTLYNTIKDMLFKIIKSFSIFSHFKYKYKCRSYKVYLPISACLQFIVKSKAE